MKTLLIGINAKYIHPNLSIKLLKRNTSYLVDLKEYTIKENINNMIDYIIGNNYKIVGFSCYIWNIEIIKIIIKKLKEINKNIIIILGGPEVSYNASSYLDIVDYVIKNEGEKTFDMLLSYLIDNKNNLEEIPNLYHKNGYTFDLELNLNEVKTAYDLIDDLNNQIIYFETSRGCPFNCAYCMASLEKSVRYFNMDTIKKDLLNLLNKGAKTIKFLDRTFNSNKSKFIELIDFLIENHKPYNSFQFEITGDLLDDDIINYINNKAPKNLFRFEIGIQSTNILSNKLVYRIQNNEKLFKNIRLIQDSNIIDLHLDLIAGLPKEDYNSFKNTFNQVLDLRPKELQLGFLKLLHGTRLEKECHLYNYKFQETAPYEIISNDSLDEKDLYNIHICEDAFEKYYNYGYMNDSIQYILDNINNYFDFFYDLGVYIINNKKIGLDGVFKNLDDFLKIYDYNFYDEAHILLIIDYLKYNNVKSKSWWDKTTTNKNNIIRELYNNGFNEYDLHILYKYAYIVEYKNTIILALYIDNKSYVYRFKKEE